MNVFDTLHFLRPQWLLLLPLTLAAAGLWWRHAPQRTRWSQICDPELLPHLLAETGAGPRSRAPWLMLLLAVLVPLAMAGPAWKRLPQPVFEVPQDVLLVMDLSQSMAATDVRPSRLDRARYAAHDLLAAQREGQTGLVAFAGSAFAVVPLTTDRRTVAHLLDSLDTALMPRQGSRIDAGLAQALELLDNAGSRRATVIVLTDSPGTAPARSAATALREAGHAVDVIGIGTAAGAPVPLPAGGWATDGDGVALARLDDDSLRALARAGGGRYQALAARADVAGLLSAPPTDWAGQSEAADLNADQWRDEGFWLILLALPLVASGFRRGALMAALLTLPLLQPQPAYAWEWQGLWRNADQRAHERLPDDPAAAAELFADPQWSASAHYRAGEYEQAAELFGQDDSAASHYNRGNALARAGQLQQALDAYDAAMSRDPDLTDARDNRDLVQQLLDQQQDSQQGEESDDGDPQDGDSGQSTSESGDAGEPSDRDDSAQDSGQPQSSQAQDGESAAEQAQAPAEVPDPSQDSDDPAAQTTTDESAEGENGDSATAEAVEAEPADEATQAMEQWLRRIPDDPGGLLREKFRRQQQRRQSQSDEPTPW